MKSFPFAVLVACVVASAAVPTSNLCEDAAIDANIYNPRYPWRLDTAYFAESPPGAKLNDWSWKHQYSATTGYPISITVDFFEGEGPKTYPFVPTESGFYIQNSELGFEHHAFRTNADTLIHNAWRTRSDTIVDSVRISSWGHGLFGLQYEKLFVDTLKVFWSNDTLFDMYLPSRDRNTSTSIYHPSIDTCFSISQNECECHNGSYSKLTVRAAWNDGFKISRSKLDSSNGNDISIRFYRPISAYTSVKRRVRANAGQWPTESLRWNGARSPEASSSTNPIELLRHGQIPQQAR